jgi:hypothetical protein
LAEAAPPYDRDSLDARGWRQGSLLPATAPVRPAVWISDQEQGWSKARKDASARARRGELSSPYLYERPSKQSDRFALISQECDVLKPPDEFPIVEFALVFETLSDAVIQEANSLTSARYFRLSDQTADGPIAILDYRFKAQAEKGVLVEHAPDNALVSNMSEARCAVLRGWLGRRLGREAVSDEDTLRIVEPIRSAWKALTEEQSELASEWGHLTSELRFRRTEGPRLRLYIITHDQMDAGDPDLLEMADWVVQQISWSESLIDLTITSEWVMTVAEHRATQEIDLAWASYEEDQAAA